MNIDYKDTALFLDWIKRIVQWNSECLPEGKEQLLDTQFNVTREEIQETIDALEQSTLGDLDDFIDGVCDVIVTGGYLSVLLGNTGGVGSAYQAIMDCEEVGYEPEDYIDGLRRYLTSILNVIDERHEGGDEYVIDLDLINGVYCMALAILRDRVRINSYMEAVLRSNDSKILSSFSQADIDFELDRAEDLYGEVHDDIVFVKTGPVTGVIRSNNGEGKILKPSQYLSPEEILTMVDE